MTGRTVTIEMVRQAVQALCEGGAAVSNQQIYLALALNCEAEKACARSRISNMVQHGELIREGESLYRYNFAKRPRDPKTHAIVWRFVRASKPGWRITDCAIMTRVSYTQVLRYCNWLLEEGYIAQFGKDERNTVTYRATEKAMKSPETPYPPLRETDPFAKEKAAAVRIIDALLRADPYAKKTARAITEACHILLSRFEKGEAESLTRNENKEETC